MNQRLAAMPGSVRSARTIMCIQIALLLVVAAIMTLAVTQTAAPQAIALLAISSAAIAIFGVVVVKMRTRRRWVRWVAVVTQAVLASGYLPGLITDMSIGGLVGLALAIAATVSLLTASSAAWFNS